MMRTRSLGWVVSLAVALGAWGCGGGEQFKLSEPGTSDAASGGSGGSGAAGDADASVDVTGEAAQAEAGQDAVQEALAESSVDGGPDVGPDAGAEAGVDVTEEAPSSDGCVAVSVAPDVDPWNMRLASAGFGGIVTSSSGGHTDVFLKSPTDYIRVGARLDWGGTIVFFGLTSNPQWNVIDANDTGRELQLALYDPTRAMQGCAWNASCQSTSTSCPMSITFLGWNPVQGGDECGHGAPVLSHGQAGDGLELVVQPLQWNPDWDKQDCSQTPCEAQGRPVQVQYRMVLRFVAEHVVEVATEVTSQESFSHPATWQEFPTLYVAHGGAAPDLPVLLEASGQTISLSTPGNDGFYYDNFTSSGPWVSWQNTAQNYGVGIAMDQGVRQWQGWRGDGATAPYFHNVRAQMVFGLAAGGAVRGISYLALGGFAMVKSQLEDILSRRPPFGALDAPAAGSTTTYVPGSAIQVTGWALDTEHVASVDVEIDGVRVAQLANDASRADVCAMYPMYDGCPGVGFSGAVPTAGLDGCPHLLRVVARDGQGNATVLGERVIQASGN